MIETDLRPMWRALVRGLGVTAGALLLSMLAALIAVAYRYGRDVLDGNHPLAGKALRRDWVAA